MTIKKAILATILGFGVIQLIPYGKNHTNPNVQNEPKWDSKDTRALFMRACGDCHSFETKWPWYSNVAPISWLVQSDVNEGREHFNTSMWGLQKKNKSKDAYEELEDSEMPPLIYTLNHPKAKLSKQEKERLISGLKKTFNKGK